jgi:cell division septation protein DedD
MKIKIISCIIAALFIFTSASIWEGSAVTASDGYLPGKGLYAATNSFPRNTVVEITNLENNRSIRVIVAEGLDSSGLLALVSQDAAEWLGMSRDSISRIRMTQPSDPIAYKRFTDGMAAGIPDYDSGAVVTENQPLAQALFPSAPSPQNSALEIASSSLPRIFLEEEFGGKREIEDLPKNYAKEESLYIGTRAVDNNPDIKNTSDMDRDPVYELVSNNERSPVYELIPEIVSNNERTAVYELIPEIAENNSEPEHKQATAQITETAKEPVQHEIDKDLTYTIVIAEERPPKSSSIYDIDLNEIIPGINRPSPAEIPLETDYIPALAPKPAHPPARSFTIDPISRLKRGSYYVQIASLQGQELVESALGRIDADYEPVVFKDDGNWYRILLGPLNQGESGAILQRFRSIGYKDSFIRQGK